MQPFSILQQSRPPICMQFVAFQSHRMSDRAPTECEIKRHKICQIEFQKKTSDRMSDVNPWIFRLKTSGFTADRKSALWTPRRGSLLCDVMLRHCMECYAMSSYVTSCCVMLHYVVLLLCVLVFWVCMHARMTCVCVYFSYHIHIIIHPYLVPQRVGYNLSYNWTKGSWGQQASKSPPPNRSVIFHEFIQIPSNPHRIPLISQ